MKFAMTTISMYIAVSSMECPPHKVWMYHRKDLLWNDCLVYVVYVANLIINMLGLCGEQNIMSLHHSIDLLWNDCLVYTGCFTRRDIGA